jgi:cell division protein FtsX
VLTTTSGARPARIVAVSDRYAAIPTDRAYLIAGPAFARAHLGLSADARPRRLVLRSRDGSDPAVRFAALRAALGPEVTRLSSGAEQLEKRLKKTSRDFLIFDAVFAVLVVLATVGTVGTIGLRALERRRELALMRVLGTTRRQFRTYFTAQGFAVGLVGGLLALAAAVPFTAAATAGLRRVSGMDVRFVYGAAPAAVCLALAVGLGTLAGVLAHGRARRIDWAAALKYE